MTRTTRALSALAVAGAAVLAPVGTGVAHAETTAGFTEIKRFDWGIRSMTAPGGGVVVAVGDKEHVAPAPGETMVAYRLGGQWTEQSLGYESRTVLTASDEGIVYVLTQNHQGGLTFWQTVGTTLTPMPLPDVPAGARLDSVSMAVDGQTVVVAGQMKDAEGVHGVLFTRSGGRWTTTRLDGLPWSGPDTSDSAITLSGVRDGRAAFTWTEGHSSPGSWATVWTGGLYNTPITSPTGSATPTWLGQSMRYEKLDDADQTYERTETTSFVNAYDVTLWGGLYHWNTGGVKGECRRFVNGTAADCPAPEWIVSQAAHMQGGRTVLGGNARGNGKSGYAVAGPDGSLTPVPGKATNLYRLVADPVDDTAWSAEVQGSISSTAVWQESIVYEATLPR